MAFTKNTDDLNIIQKLPDEPNDVGGLTAAQLKAKFDEAGGKLKTSLNGLVDELGATTAAANVGFNSTAGVPEDNVQDAIENVQEQLADISQGSVADGSISTVKLADSAVTSAKLADGSVTNAKLAIGSIAFEDVSNYIGISAPNGSNTSIGSSKFLFSEALGLCFYTIVASVEKPSSQNGYIYMSTLNWSYDVDFNVISSYPASVFTMLMSGYNDPICITLEVDNGGHPEFAIRFYNDWDTENVIFSGWFFCKKEES